MSRTRHTDKEKARIIRELEQHNGSAPAGPLVELELAGAIILRIYPARLA
jgi:hypothetical protein